LKENFMIQTRILIPLAVLAVAISGAAIWWQASPPAWTIKNPPAFSESEAISRAIEEARFGGLDGEPTEVRAELMTWGDYGNLSGFTPGRDAVKVGLAPDMPVWVVAMNGRVVWSLPGRPGGGPSEISDSITVVLNAKTGEIKAYSRFGPDNLASFSE
jgi:hypothetical protein